MTDDRTALHARVKAFIARGERDDDARDALLLALAAHQRRSVPPYARFCAQRLAGRTPSTIAEAPALPTDAFRFARIASRPEHEDVRRFQSSGTTSDARSLHPLQDLSLYDAAAESAARHALFPDVARIDLVLFAPSERELPDSSLSYMLARFVDWFGTPQPVHMWPLDTPRIEALSAHLARAQRDGAPLALLGTSFAFVHAIDALGDARFALPPGSRIMQTGGFKGRSRELSPSAMRALLSRTFGVPDARIVAEYGMTELSSQLYETTLRAQHCSGAAGPRRLWAPPWVRVSVVDPETLAPAPTGALGLVRIDDAANLDGVSCIQTADLGVLDAHGLTLHGRAADAVARGCSITAAQLLGEPPR